MTRVRRSAATSERWSVATRRKCRFQRHRYVAALAGGCGGASLVRRLSSPSFLGAEPFGLTGAPQRRGPCGRARPHQRDPPDRPTDTIGEVGNYPSIGWSGAIATAKGTFQ
jgi:hypothetical protein